MNLTVLIPVYNTQPHHLMESVFSIIHQDDGNKHRIILIDDGSTDYETTRALQFFERYENIETYHIPHGGTSSALNYGHSIVKTEFVALQGGDDVSHPSRFKHQINLLKSDKKADVVSTNLFSYYDDDITRKPLFTSFFPQIVTKPYARTSDWWANHGTVVYRQEAVMKAGLYDKSIGRGQDVDLWKRMKAQGCRFTCVTDVCYAWRRFR